MTRNFDAIAATFTIIFLGMAFSAYVFAKPISTVILIGGGISLGILALYGISLHITERKEKSDDQPVEIAPVQEQQDDQTQIRVWEETAKTEETQENISLSATGS